MHETSKSPSLRCNIDAGLCFTDVRDTDRDESDEDEDEDEEGDHEDDGDDIDGDDDERICISN